MKFPEIRYFVPPPLDETFAIIRFSQTFYQEAAYRQAHARHCQWYAETAAQNRAELNKMANDINLMRWFRR